MAFVVYGYQDANPQRRPYVAFICGYSVKTVMTQSILDPSRFCARQLRLKTGRATGIGSALFRWVLALAYFAATDGSYVSSRKS